jgi:hypothetical protein
MQINKVHLSLKGLLQAGLAVCLLPGFSLPPRVSAASMWKEHHQCAQPRWSGGSSGCLPNSSLAFYNRSMLMLTSLSILSFLTGTDVHRGGGIGDLLHLTSQAGLTLILIVNLAGEV